MPGPLSWFFHHLPKPLHRVEVAVNHVTQLVVPFGVFAPQPIATVAGAIVVVTQLWLISGQLCVAELADDGVGVQCDRRAAPHRHVGRTAGMVRGAHHRVQRPGRGAELLAGAESALAAAAHVNVAFDPLHLVNTRTAPSARSGASGVRW